MALSQIKTSGAARMAVIYITTGAIMDVWTVLWFIWMKRHATTDDGPYFWCYGFFLTGLTLLIIGLALGKIGRAARHAEAPSETTSSNAASAQQPVGIMGVSSVPAVPVTPMNHPATAPGAVPGGAVAPNVGQPVAGTPGTFPRR
jgi:hypothetical protein